MDNSWRLVAGFFLKGADLSQCRVSYNREKGIVVIHRPDALQRDTVKVWGRLMHSSGNASALKRLKEAIALNDVVVIRQLMRTLLHVVCDKVHITIQSHDDENPLNIWWRSAVHRPNDRSASYRGTRGAVNGTTFHVWVHDAYTQYIDSTHSWFPTIQHAHEVAIPQQLADDASVAHLGQTPNRFVNSVACSPASAGFTPAVTPAMYGEDCLIYCDLCGVHYPQQLTATTGCGHVSCWPCLGSSVQRRATNPYATPNNLQCPHAFCSEFLTREEVRQLVTSDVFTALEWNELRNLLKGGAVQCPGCGYMYERIISEDIQNDPLRDKLTCVACHGTFCAMCHTFPYHDGRLCKHGGDDGSAAPKCRYCENPAQSTDPPVCDAPLCRSRGQQACVVPKSCGHHCYGSCGEQSCVACLEEDCPSRHPQQCADDFCVICFTDALADAPCLQLECGHVFHKACVEKKIEQRWPCARINFKFLQCPLCEKEMSHHLLAKNMAPVNKLREALEKRYEDRLKMEGMDECDALTDPQSVYFKKPLKYAADQFNYYQCSKCKRPYFGGLRRCQDVERDEPDKSDLVCGGCCAGSAQCDRHGNHYLEWKCKYCCNTAVWFCWGTTHFCELCHSPPRKTVREECEGEERCPLGAKHPPNGTEFALGCAMCRSKAKETKPTGPQ